MIRLTAGDAFAVIALKGAEPLAWSIRGRDLLWNADPAYWERTSPILFPIVGRARNDTIHVDGRPYGLGVHGFAAMKQFSLVTQTTDSVRLILRDDCDTREMFPFPFELEVNFELEPSALSVRFLVRNSGATALPYAIGFHPGFPWTLDKGREEHRVEFEQDESPLLPVITKEGFFLARTRRVPLEGNNLPLSDELIADGALCFLNARSKSMRLVSPNDAISFAVDDFPHFAVWSKHAAPFVCLEAWTGHGDPDDFEGDIRQKASMRLLRPGAEARHAVRLVYDDYSPPNCAVLTA